eukprot:365247-Rhodomonas_salina.1
MNAAKSCDEPEDEWDEEEEEVTATGDGLASDELDDVPLAQRRFFAPGQRIRVLRVQGLGFRVWGLGFRVQGLATRVNKTQRRTPTEKRNAQSKSAADCLCSCTLRCAMHAVAGCQHKRPESRVASA